MGITPHHRISTKHQQHRGRSPRGWRPIINKREGGTLYQKKRDPWLLIPRPLRNFGKQTGTMGVTPTILLWILPAQYSTHDLRNAKQMANKINPYMKNRPGRRLPPDTCKRDNRIDLHCNSRRASLYLPEVNLWCHNLTRRIYNC